MADYKLQARSVFDTLCAALDHNDWKYDKNAEKLRVDISATGEDLPMDVIISVEGDRGVVFLMSHLPVKTPEDKLIDMAIAVASANSGMRWGNFDYGIQGGQLYFRMAGCFIDSLLGEEFFQDMLMCAFSTIDKYNDRFLMLAKGMITVEKFIELDKQ